MTPWHEQPDGRWCRSCGLAWVECCPFKRTSPEGVRLFLVRGGVKPGWSTTWTYTPRRISIAKRTATNRLKRMAAEATG